jgi:hypothetical protein
MKRRTEVMMENHVNTSESWSGVDPVCGMDVAMESAGVTLVKGDPREIRARTALESRDYAQYPPERVFRLYLQLFWRACGGRSVVSSIWTVTVADYRCCSDELQFGVCDQQCAQTQVCKDQGALNEFTGRGDGGRAEKIPAITH